MVTVSKNQESPGVFIFSGAAVILPAEGNIEPSHFFLLTCSSTPVRGDGLLGSAQNRETKGPRK